MNEHAHLVGSSNMCMCAWCTGLLFIYSVLIRIFMARLWELWTHSMLGRSRWGECFFTTRLREHYVIADHRLLSLLLYQFILHTITHTHTRSHCLGLAIQSDQQQTCYSISSHMYGMHPKHTIEFGHMHSIFAYRLDLDNSITMHSDLVLVELLKWQMVNEFI